jgi:hypothetical protein
MPTIMALIGVLVVYGLVLAGLLLIVKVLPSTTSRYEQTLRVDLDARRLRLKLLIAPTRSRSGGGPSTPDENQRSSGPSEKAS